MAKTFFQDGKWIDSPRPVAVSLCKCGAKYIKTRDGQTVCLGCLTTRRHA